MSAPDAYNEDKLCLVDIICDQQLFVLLLLVFVTLQDRQCTYKVILKRVRELFLPWESNKYYIFVCVCVYARALANVRV